MKRDGATDENLFEIGQRVGLRVDHSRSGVVVGIVGEGEAIRYRVFHGPGEREYDADQLVAVTSEAEESILDVLDEGAILSRREFSARLTAARLAHPSTDELYAMEAARIQHVPFQYKPLLRLLRADQPRLLIADDVGVGKTIEAGLILKELQARTELERVLIVCPRALTLKWRIEMKRFDEEFKILDGPALRHSLREADLDGWPPEFARAILPFELIQREDYREGDEHRPGLLTLDEAPQFDLLIIDEAHHVRNADTGRYSAVDFLASISDAAIFLSATPVHTGARNLFTLLQLLRPDLFPDFETFERMVTPNRFITEAMRYVRGGGNDGWQAKAGEALDRAAQTDWGADTLAHDVRVESWQKQLASAEPLSDEQRIRCLRELEEVHSLALVMNRTRRRDIGRFTQREPRTVEVPFTPLQQAFYNRLVEWQRRVLIVLHGPLVANLVLSQLERQAASCIFGVGENLAAIVADGGVVQRRREDDDDDGDGVEQVQLPPELLDEAVELLGEFDALPPDDPKLEELRALAGETLGDEAGPGKLLVFTFFRKTIAYLERNLREQDLRVAVVHGDVPDDERQELRARFRLDRREADAIDVLISTEVGAEGLDYEFCDRLVNYDIPWNPMRVEQRIGRIDRFGQRSPKVLIFNFITPGTVEERVFWRCFERLGIFRDTVGDLEEVLGEMVLSLNRLATDPALTSEQIAERAQQEADNVLRKAEEQRRLENEAPSLLGLDAVLQDEADEIGARGRYVQADELQNLIDGFLAAVAPGASLTPAPGDEPDLLTLRVPSAQARDELRTRLAALPRHRRTAKDLRKVLETGGPVELTFARSLAAERHDVPFITPVHPLARIATEFWQERPGPLTVRLESHDGTLEPGEYLFAFERWEEIASKPSVRLVGLAVRVTDGHPTALEADELMALIRDSQDAPADERERIPSEAMRSLDELALNRRRRSITKLQQTNAALVEQRIRSVDLYFRALIGQLEAAVAAATDPRIARMKASERTRREAEHQRRRARLEESRDADITTQRIAVGVIKVRDGL